MPDRKDFQLSERSPEADEVFGRLPSWVIRWGITVIAGILLGIVVACFFIRYPQTISSNIVLTSDNPPSDLLARYSGLLDSVYVADGALVAEGELIALIATPANYEHVREVEELLRHLQDSITLSDARAAVRLQGLHLGNLQGDWISLQRSCSDYLNWRELDQTGRKIAMLNTLAAESAEYAGFLARERENVQEDLRYGTIAFRRDSVLREGDLISQAEYEQSIMSLHTKENELTSLDASLSNARLSGLQYKSQALDLRLQASTEEMAYLQDIRRGARQLLADIASWKDTYAFLAPFAGRVSLQNVWASGPHIDVGDLVASVVRADGSNITGRLKVASSGFGKVREGQRVIVRLNGYPYMEFGVLPGIVTSISSVPEQSSAGLVYTVTVSFPKGMETTYHRTLSFVQKMDGEAQIVTEDMRLIEQFFRPVRSLFANH